MKQLLKMYEALPSIIYDYYTQYLPIITNQEQKLLMQKIVISIYFLALLSPCFSELTVAVIGTNDIHGKAFPTLLARQDTGEKYNYGGLVYMATLINIINSQNPGNALYLDAGDQFQGGIEASKLISNGMIMTDFYNLIQTASSSIGNHQFDFGPQFLFPYMQSKNSLNLAANLRSQNGQLNFLPKQKSSAIYQMANGIKIGTIGLSTLQTPSTTSGFSGKLFPPYQFLAYKRFVEDESAKLKKLGANIVLIVSHVGDDCPIDLVYKNRTKDTIQEPCPQDQLTQLLNSLQKGTIHGVVQGHRHRMAHHYRKDIPYIGTINGGYYFNVIYFKFDQNKNLIDTVIEGPIPVCEKIFQNIGRCNYLSKQQLATAGQLKAWKFHNQDVFANQDLNNLFETKWMPQMYPYFKDLVINEIELMKEDTKQSQLANLFTNLIHQAVPEADFVILNPGGFRTTWLPGVIQFQHFYNMLPFENMLKTFEIKGSEMLQMFRIIQNGQKGFYHCWNIQMQVTYQNFKKGFVSAKFMDGTEIDPDKNYIGATVDFLLNGGDDFKDVINIVYTPKNVVNKGDYKVEIQPFLQDLKVIKIGSLIDPQNPRLIIN